MKSPTETTLASLSAASSLATKACSTVAWATRWTSEERTGAWKRLSMPWSPPLLLKWLAMTKTFLPRKENWPISGLRLLVHEASAGEIRPGEAVSEAAEPVLTTSTALVAVPPGMSVKETRCGLNRKTWRMLPPGSPPSLPSSGSTERQSYAGPPAALIAATNLATVWLASTVPSLLAPLLSWISSRATTSGERRWVTTPAASSANLLSGLVAARFSTL